MAKVKYPLLSGDARGDFAGQVIFTRGGQARGYFQPRNPNSAAQQLHRAWFREKYMAKLSREEADLLYATISHLHDDRYSVLGHLHDERYARKNYPIEWIAPTLLNSWQNNGEEWGLAKYGMDELGFVHLTGYIRGGASGSVGFVLPEGYRPVAVQTILTLASGAIGWINVYPNGNVMLYGNGVTYFLLTAEIIL